VDCGGETDVVCRSEKEAAVKRRRRGFHRDGGGSVVRGVQGKPHLLAVVRGVQVFRLSRSITAFVGGLGGEGGARGRSLFAREERERARANAVFSV
jgi:hypothetical protein